MTLIIINHLLSRVAHRSFDFVQSTIVELFERQLIQEHSSPPHCVNPLTVAEGKKLRLLIDLREVNRYLVKSNIIIKICDL